MSRVEFAANPRPIGPKIGKIPGNIPAVFREPRKPVDRPSFMTRPGRQSCCKRKIMLGKGTFFLGLLGMAVAPVAAEPVASPPPAVDQHLFDILRDGNKIGSEVVEIDRAGDTTSVKFTTHISVVVMFIQAYHFEHSATETWTGGKFVSYKAYTDDNGTKHDVSAVADNDKLELDVDGTHSEAASDLVPASWWNKDFVNRTDMLDAETGRPVSIKVADLGDEPLVQNGATIQAHHYKVSGDLHRDLWFNGDTLVRIQLVGSDHSTIVSDLRPTPAPASGVPPQQGATQE